MPLVLLIAFCVASTWWVIVDARRRGMNATGWGIATALTTGLTLPIYWIARRGRRA